MVAENDKISLNSECGDAVKDLEAAKARVNAALVTIARLIGRQMAREEFERRLAASEYQPASKAEENDSRNT